MFGITLGRYQIYEWNYVNQWKSSTNFEIVKVGNFQFVNVRFVHFLGAFLGMFSANVPIWNYQPFLNYFGKLKHSCENICKAFFGMIIFEYCNATLTRFMFFPKWLWILRYVIAALATISGIMSKYFTVWTAKGRTSNKKITEIEIPFTQASISR